MDRIDLNILTALYREARISKVQMSTEVGLSASRCYERMRRLEHSKVIRGYHADIDIARLASCLQFMVQVKLLRIPEIIACQGVLGTIDYILVVIAATVEKYQDVIGKLRAASECEFDFVTFPVSGTIKSTGQSDLGQVMGRLVQGAGGGAP